MEHYLDSLEASEYKNRAVFAKLRADEYQGDFPISSVPLTAILTSGTIFHLFGGIVSVAELCEKLDAAIDELAYAA